MREKASNLFKQRQEEISAELELLDGKEKFVTENWEYPTGGGGITKVLQDGDVIEKGGVNFSEVTGVLPASMCKRLLAVSYTHLTLPTKA